MAGSVTAHRTEVGLYTYIEAYLEICSCLQQAHCLLTITHNWTSLVPAVIWQ